MLIRAGGGIFPPSDLYQVQDCGWVIWLIEAFLLQSCGCVGNDRPALQNWGLEFTRFLLSTADSPGMFV